MAKQLTQELIDLAQAEGIYDSICWENGISSLDHVNHVSQVLDPNNRPYVFVPQAIIDFLADTDNPDLFEPSVDYPAPIFSEISRTKFAVEKPSITFTIHGSYLSPGNVVTSDTLNIDSVVFVDAHEIKVTINTLSVNPDLVGKVFLDGVEIASITTFTSTWIDLREGGTTITNYDLNSVTQAQIVRDANGIGTTNSAGSWAKLVALPDFTVPRDHSNGVQIVYYIQSTGVGMFGMIASGHGVDTSMYNETHIGAYINSATNLWGFYSFANQSNSENLSGYNRVKLVCPTTMSPGSDYRIYGLKSGDTWDNEDNLLVEGTIPSGTQDPGDLVYPCLTPNSGITARLQAFNPAFS